MAGSSRLRSSPLAAVYTIHPPAGQGAEVRDGNERGRREPAEEEAGRRQLRSKAGGGGLVRRGERSAGQSRCFNSRAVFKFRFLIGTGLRPSVSP